MEAGFKTLAAMLVLTLGLTGCVSTRTAVQPAQQNQAVADYMNLAKGYLQAGYTEKAVKPLTRALEIEPGSAEVYGLLGTVYQIQEEYPLAEQAFSKALSLNPGATGIRNNYGAFLFERNRLNEAFRQFERASSDVSYPQRSRTFENMGVVALRQGNPQLASNYFDKALRLNASLPKANLELADIFFIRGNNQKAWQHYQAFTGLSRQNARSLWLGIQLAGKTGDTDKVASYALQLERLYPGSREYREYRSRTGYEY